MSNENYITVTTCRGVKSTTKSQTGIQAGGVTVGIDLRELARINSLTDEQLKEYLTENKVRYSEGYTYTILRELAVMHETQKLEEDSYVSDEDIGAKKEDEIKAKEDIEDGNNDKDEIEEEIKEIMSLDYSGIKNYLTLNAVEFKGNDSDANLKALAVKYIKGELE